MNIEIHKAKAERRMREGIQSSCLPDVRELLAKAHDALSGQEAAYPHSGSALLEAMQASPHKEIDLQPRRDRLPVRDADL